jgi:hypothetical protein
MYKQFKKSVRKFKAWMNYNPPGAMSSKGWRLFDKEFKERAPIRHWIDNDFKKICVYPIQWKYEAVSNWIRYRTYDRYHIVSTGLEPNYHSIDKLMLHVNFNMLKDFIEVEQAWRTYSWSDEYKSASWFEKHMPFYRTFYKFRRPDLGIQHLDWAATLDDPALPPNERSDHQAITAREIKLLYIWWTQIRPARVEHTHPDYEQQGLGFLGFFDIDFDKDAEDYKKYIASMDAINEQAEDWEKEDEEMLIRLIRVRRSLWT